ncbi:hypothetical protein I7I50_06300 [Histoplasma capsulatum G186AR]|nr:hypothetical protein I7I52_10628 [Histoplasma capsulatum]QSS67277.1 hypothetical protein I7I50_06300 [Histoplasma capsulatum G186AR]
MTIIIHYTFQRENGIFLIKQSHLKSTTYIHPHSAQNVDIMKFRILFTFASFFLVALASVLPAPLENQIWKRQNSCPSLEEISDFLKEKGIGENTVFYAYPGTIEQASKYAKSECSKDFTYFMSDPKWADWMAKCASDAGSRNDLFRRTPKAMGQLTKKYAYLILPDGKDANERSIWWEEEYPELLKNRVAVLGVTPTGDNPDDWEIYEYDPAKKAPH